MNLFKWLLGKTPATKSDLWERVGRSYVGMFRAEINQFTEKLPAHTFSRYNPEFKCVEIVLKNGLVFCQFIVHGQYGIPEDLLVTTVTDMPADLIGQLEEIFHGKLKRFKYYTAFKTSLVGV